MPSVSERVSVIRKLMAGLLWCGAEERRLRAEWGCSPAVVKTAAAEASRQLSQAGDAEHDRRRIEGWAARAEASARRCESQGNHHAAGKIYLDLIKTMARVSGIEQRSVTLSIEGAGTDAVLAKIVDGDGGE